MSIFSKFNYVLGVIFIFMASGMAIVSAGNRGEPPSANTVEVPPAIVGTITIEYDNDLGSTLKFEGKCRGDKFIIEGSVIDLPTMLPNDITREFLEATYFEGAHNQLAIYAPKCVRDDLPLGLTVSNVGHVSHISDDMAIAHGVVILFYISK